MRGDDPKGIEYIHELGTKGGLASGKTRQANKVARVLGIPPIPAELLKRPNRAGGSHDSDWRCKQCHYGRRRNPSPYYRDS
jgi:hypothetical protein